jgi:hypothetical protein
MTPHLPCRRPFSKRCLRSTRSLTLCGAPEEEWRRRLDEARRPIEVKRMEHEAELEQLSAEWDHLTDGAGRSPGQKNVLAALRDRMLERNYIANLLSSIDQELSRGT